MAILNLVSLLSVSFYLFIFVLIFFFFSSFFAGNVPIMNKKAKFESRANQLLNAPKVFFIFFDFLIHNIKSDVFS